MQQFKRKKEMATMMVSAVIFFGILTLAAGTASAREATPKYGGTLKIAVPMGPSGFDVIKARSAVGMGSVIGQLVMEKLFDMGENGELLPVLGLSATPSSDEKSWTIKLRKGVNFHDGTMFNADAVVHHWKRILDPGNRYRYWIQIRPIVSVEKIGEYEVQFNLKYAWLPFVSVLTDTIGFASSIPSPAAVDGDIQNRAPVGTGRFIFKEWKSRNRVVLVKNPDYWQKGKPYLDGVVYLIIPDYESQYAALVSGQADMTATDRPTQVQKLIKNPEFRHQVDNYRGATAMILNNSKPPLDDVRVRNAIALAWDQKKYIKASYKDITPYIESWLGDASNTDDTGYHHYDPDKARQLIAAYGKPVELEFNHTPTARGRTAGMIVQQMMKEIGVKVNPVPMDFSGIIQKLFSRKFDITSWIFTGGFDMGPHTVAHFHSRSPWNVTGYASPEVDKLLVRQRMSTDPAERAAILNKIVKKVNSDSPFIYLNGLRYYRFYRNDVKNIKPLVPGQAGRSGSQFNVWLDR